MPSEEDHRDTRDRVIAIEQRMAHLSDTLHSIASKVDCVLERSVKRDSEVNSIKAQVEDMGPSVKILKDGLVFWKISRWVFGILALVGSAIFATVNSLDNLKAFIRAYLGITGKSS